MSSLTTLARPYAKAAFELAQDQQALARWEKMLTLAAEMAMDDSMVGLLESPHVSNSAVVKIITDAAGESFDSRFRDFLYVLADNGRLPLLPQLTKLYHQFREEAENRLSVTVVSAIPLDDEQAGRMKEALARRLACEIELNNEIDEGVIGGAVVYAGDQVIDGSLLGKLEKLSAGLAN